MSGPDGWPWSYVGRFGLVHLVTYTAVAFVFLPVQEALPVSRRLTLDAFAPYRPLGALESSAQLLRGVVLALILAPVNDRIVCGRRGGSCSSAALWGVAVLGSVEPLPGSFEGAIHVESTAVEHASVLAANAAQVGLFASLFFQWKAAQRAHVRDGPVYQVGV